MLRGSKTEFSNNDLKFLMDLSKIVRCSHKLPSYSIFFKILLSSKKIIILSGMIGV